jgi:hypothetical protein
MEEFEACGSFVRTKRLSDGGGGLLVAECAHCNGFGERTAKLFAMAPLMLTALKEIEAYAKRDGDLVGQAIASIAGEAIEKVEREQG